MRPGGGDGAKAMAQEGGRRVDHFALTAAAAGEKKLVKYMVRGNGREGDGRNL